MMPFVIHTCTKQCFTSIPWVPCDGQIFMTGGQNIFSSVVVMCFNVDFVYL